jgi:eukaryotic-like serine/threonine-protein kinase
MDTPLHARRSRRELRAQLGVNNFNCPGGDGRGGARAPCSSAANCTTHRRRGSNVRTTTQLERIDACWAVATGLGFADLLTSAAYFAKGTRLALEAGEPIRVARWSCLRAVQVALPGRPAGRRAGVALSKARAAVARVDDPLAEGLLRWAQGAGAHALGRWKATVARCDAAVAAFRTMGRSVWWELTGAQIMAESALYWLGELAELHRRVEREVADGEARGDLLAVVTRRAGGLSAVSRLAADDPRRAQAELADAMARWTRSGLHVQHWYAFQAAVQIALYRDDRRQLQRAIDEQWSRLDRAWLHRAQTLRITGRWRHACAQLGLVRGDDSRLACVRKEARRLGREGLPWARALADLVDASAAAHEGDDATAIAKLESAVVGCDRSEMHLLASIARLRLGKMIGGHRGETSVAQADEALQRCSVAQPLAFSRILLPWPDA